MTSARTWQSILDETLHSLPAKGEGGRPRVSVLGIGREQSGDDAAGLIVARTLTSHTHRDLQVLEGAHAPENQLGPISNFAPDLVLLIDAAELNLRPGEIAWIDWQDTTGISASTHTLPLYMIGKYLETMVCCTVALIGIQPVSTEVDASPSAEVLAAVNQICTQLAARLS